MGGFNKVIVMGNFTRDIEVKTLPSGTMVADCTVAVNDRVKKQDEWVDEVTFVDVAIWGRQAENCAKFCRKGSTVLIEGKLRQESWEHEGKKKSKLKVSATSVTFVDKKNSDNGSYYQPSQTDSSANTQTSDIPF